MLETFLGRERVAVAENTRAACSLPFLPPAATGVSGHQQQKERKRERREKKRKKREGRKEKGTERGSATTAATAAAEEPV
jgi:hypothetical protein